MVQELLLIKIKQIKGDHIHIIRSTFIFFMGENNGIESNWWCRCLNFKSQFSISLKLTNFTFLKQISINLKNTILIQFFLMTISSSWWTSFTSFPINSKLSIISLWSSVKGSYVHKNGFYIWILLLLSCWVV